MSVQLMSAELPSPLLTMVDFASRNPVTCKLEDCTICKRIESETQTTFFGAVNMSASPEHFCSTAGWIDIQKTDKDLKRCHAALASGSKIPKKGKNYGILRKYLKVCSISKNRLLVVKKTVDFQAKLAELKRHLLTMPLHYVYTWISKVPLTM